MIKSRQALFSLKLKTNSGFTLIELMIAITILSLLLFTGSYSYSLMSERWNKELGQFSASAKNSKHLELLQRLLEGVQPYVVVDKNKKPSFFFIGDKTSLLGVSRTGLFETEYPVIFRLTTVDKGNGKVDLMYQSASTENILLLGTDQNIEFSKQLTLFNDIEGVEFSYFGWPHLYEKNSETKNMANHRWYQRYSGIDNQLMPESFQISLTKEQQLLTIPVLLEAKPERWLAPYFEENQ